MNKTATPSIGELRAKAKALGVTYYKQGSQWIRSAWSEHHRAHVLSPMHYSLDSASEKHLLLRELGELGED